MRTETRSYRIRIDNYIEKIIGIKRDKKTEKFNIIYETLGNKFYMIISKKHLKELSKMIQEVKE